MSSNNSDALGDIIYISVDPKLNKAREDILRSPIDHGHSFRNNKYSINIQ